MGQESVAVGEVRVRVEGYGRHLELAREGAPVQRLDVAELVDVAPVTGVDSARGHGPEHEGVVRVRAVGNVDGAHGTGNLT